MMDEKKSFEELMSFIEEMGGWEELDEADLESVRQRVKKMDVNDWQKAYEKYYSNPEVIEKIRKEQLRARTYSP
jgi:hypothetical protein